MSVEIDENAPELKVLIVDDQAENVRILASILKDLARVSFSLSGKDAIEKARSQKPDLILLDVLMPDMNGYDVIDSLKADEETSQIPVIFVTGLKETVEEEEGLRRGAIDYITKPYHPSIVKARVTNQLTLRKYSLQLEKVNRELELLATTDPLTGCYNRRYFREKGQEEVERVNRYKSPCSIVMFDLDKFKQVNDDHGHDVGDQVLLHFVQIVNDNIRHQDTFGRLGGEEFSLLMPETSVTNAVILGERILEDIRKTQVEFESGVLKFTCSIGAASITKETESLEAALKIADDRLYQAKNTGRDRLIHD